MREIAKEKNKQRERERIKKKNRESERERESETRIRQKKFRAPIWRQNNLSWSSIDDVIDWNPLLRKLAKKFAAAAKNRNLSTTMNNRDEQPR